jgi:hypothetical protein
MTENFPNEQDDGNKQQNQSDIAIIQVSPDVAFLGICDRASYITTGEFYFWKHHIMGLRNIVLSPVYPFPLSGFQFAIAVYDAENFQSARISIVSPTDEEVMFIGISMELLDQLDTPISVPPSGTFIKIQYPVWSVLVSDIPETSAIIKQPGQYKRHYQVS